MEREIGIGIIGCGSVAEWKYMPELRKLSGCRMRAFFGGRAEEACRKYGADDAVVCRSLPELLCRSDIDAVCVCTPNNSHCAITVAALEAGKHVICEKPMAISSAEAVQMAEAAKRRGKVLTIGHQERFAPTAQALYAFLRDGRLGRPYYMQVNMLRRLGIPTWGHFTDPVVQGGGALIDLGTHGVDLALWLLGNDEPAYCSAGCFNERGCQPTSANRWGRWNGEAFGVEDSAFGQIVMKSGAVVRINAAWALHIPADREDELEICGTEAGAVWTPQRCTVNGIRNDAFYEETLCEDTEDTANAAQLRNFLDAVRGEESVLVTAEESVTVCRVLEDLYRSAKENRPIIYQK